MPFTPAHIAAVIPLRKRWNLIWSALIVGSVAPDFEYFLTLGPHTHRLHAFPGVLYLTVPIAFAFLWIFQRFMKSPILEFLPSGIESRIDPAPFRFLGMRRLALIVLSLAIGIGTHLAWDSFTHESTMVTEHLSVEHAKVPLPVVGPKQMYKVLQYVSSVVGLALVAAYFGLWYSRTSPTHHVQHHHSGAAKIALWTTLTLVALVFAIWPFYLGYAGQIPWSREIIVLMVVRAMAALFWESLAFSVLVQARRQWMIGERTDDSARSTL